MWIFNAIFALKYSSTCMQKVIKNIKAILLVSLFLGYFFSLFAFAHAHVVDGVRIVHSHPYAQGHDETEGHTEGELLLFQTFAESFAAEPIISFQLVQPNTYEFQVDYTLPADSYVRISACTHHYRRGPPQS